MVHIKCPICLEGGGGYESTEYAYIYKTFVGDEEMFKGKGYTLYDHTLDDYNRYYCNFSKNILSQPVELYEQFNKDELHDYGVLLVAKQGVDPDQLNALK